METFGNRLRSERKRLGLNQQNFATIGGVGANAQHHYELGARLPRVDYLMRLGAAGVDIPYLLNCGSAQDLPANELAVQRLISTHLSALASVMSETASVLLRPADTNVARTLGGKIESLQLGLQLIGDRS